MFDSEKLSLRLRPLMPLTALNTCWRFLDKSAQSILDVGCGKGAPMKFINRARNFYVVGLDIFRPYLMEAKRMMLTTTMYYAMLGICLLRINHST